MWPNAKICVMGPDQLASVMQSVSGRGKSAEEQEKSFGELRGRIEKESSALYSTARIWVSPVKIFLNLLQHSNCAETARMTVSLSPAIRGMYWGWHWSWQMKKGWRGLRDQVQPGEEGRLGPKAMRVDGEYSGCNKKYIGNSSSDETSWLQIVV